MNKENEFAGVWNDMTDWFSSEEWKETRNGFYFESEDGKSMFVYEDLGFEERTETSIQLTLWLGDLPFVLQEEKNDSKVEYRLIVPPYKESYYNPRDSWCGVVYGPDGKMEKNRNVKGLPKKIDMEKTVELFIKQVAEKNFAVPKLVKCL